MPVSHEPYVWRFSKDGSKSKNRGPHNIFTETDAYTIRLADGKRDLRLEHGLHDIETKFVRLRDGPLRERQELSGEDSAWLLVFVAAMHSRTLAMRRAQTEQWGAALEIMDDMAESKKCMTPDGRKRAASVSIPGKGHHRSATLIYGRWRSGRYRP
jgi:hypothetical protein